MLLTFFLFSLDCLGLPVQSQIKTVALRPDQWGLVGGASSREAEVQKFTSLIPCQGTCLGCGPGSWLGVCERQPINISLAHQCFSLSLSLTLSLKHKIFERKLKKIVVLSIFAWFLFQRECSKVPPFRTYMCCRFFIIFLFFFWLRKLFSIHNSQRV